jgi:hypothetical protein
MVCPQTVVSHLPHFWLAHQVIEAWIGPRAKEGKCEYGSVPGAVGYYLLKGLVFGSSLLFSKKPREGK